MSIHKIYSKPSTNNISITHVFTLYSSSSALQPHHTWNTLYIDFGISSLLWNYVGIGALVQDASLETWLELCLWGSVLLYNLAQVIFPLWPSASSSVRALSNKKKNGGHILYILGWPKSLFGFFCKIIWQNSNELFGKPNNCKLFSSHL